MNNKILSNAFMWLFIGLLVCFGVSYVSTLDYNLFVGIYAGFSGINYIIFIVAEIAAAIALTLFIRKLNPIVAKILYILYCGLTGLSLTGIFVVYTASSICFVFLATALIFGIFALFGRFTKLNLGKWSTYLFIGLLAIIILEIINLFLLNNTLNMILCITTIVVFCAYVAYDVNRGLDNTFLADSENKGIYIAFQLFLDFINIFIELLRLFGNRKD